MCQTTPPAECELQVTTQAPATARQFLLNARCPAHHSRLVDDALLLVSELVTNSVVHGGPPLVVRVECDGESLRVRVRDGSPELPASTAYGQEQESGRGLALVDAISSDWGVDTAANGKHVWFALR